MIAKKKLVLIASMTGLLSFIGGNVTPAIAQVMRAISSGAAHTCVADPMDGKTYCWGYNDLGQTGHSPSTPRYTAPVELFSLSSGIDTNFFPIDAMASGRGHTCGFDKISGRTACWGSNTDGQLGDGTTVDRYRPNTVPLPGKPTRIAAGRNHSCVVIGGQVSCWGKNTSGELGNGSSVAYSTVPVAIPNLSGVYEIASYGTHTCALTSTGGVKCWGLNNVGQLGNGTLTASRTPVDVKKADGSLLTGVSAIVAGYRHTCAISSNVVYCWGEGTYGALGNGGIANSTFAVPTPLTGVAKLAAGYRHTCARLTTGEMRCWGDNTYGQLGNGTTTKSLVPVVTLISAGADLISAGDWFSCATLRTGGVKCWGYNSSGMLGNGTLVNSKNPEWVSVFSRQTMAFGRSGECWAKTDISYDSQKSNGLRCLGDYLPVNPPTDPRFPSYYNTSISSGYSHRCSTRSYDGTYCWGSNTYGVLGVSSYTLPSSTTPQRVNVSGRQVVSGRSFNLVLSDDSSSIYGWGRNEKGQLGNGTTSDWEVPTPVKVDLTNFSTSKLRAISAGDSFACAVSYVGSVGCWGDNTYGQLGIQSVGGYRTTPVPIGSNVLFSRAIAVATGSYHTCALLESGSVQCWGRNDSGQLGIGTTVDANYPKPVIGITNAVAIVAGNLHTCATLATGEVKCWGAGSRVGTASAANALVPAALPLTLTADLHADSSFTCAKRRDLSMKCWGDSSGFDSQVPAAFNLQLYF